MSSAFVTRATHAGRPVSQSCLAAALSALVLAAGCSSSLSESQCLAGDWQTVGYRDGAAGRSSARLLEHQDACVKHGVIPDRSRYLVGWQEGIASFCTPANGFAEGERGAPYARICPAELERAFADAYKDGRSLYLAASEVARLEHDLAAASDELAHVRETIVANLARIATAGNATLEERLALAAESTELARTQGRLEGEIESLALALAEQRQKVATLEIALAHRQ